MKFCVDYNAYMRCFLYRKTPILYTFQRIFLYTFQRRNGDFGAFLALLFQLCSLCVHPKTIENKGFFNRVNRVNSIFYKIPAKIAERGIYRKNSVRVFTLDRKALKTLDFMVNSGCSAVRGGQTVLRPRPPAGTSPSNCAKRSAHTTLQSARYCSSMQSEPQHIVIWSVK